MNQLTPPPVTLEINSHLIITLFTQYGPWGKMQKIRSLYDCLLSQHVFAVTFSRCIWDNLQVCGNIKVVHNCHLKIHTIQNNNWFSQAPFLDIVTGGTLIEGNVLTLIKSRKKDCVQKAITASVTLKWQLIITAPPWICPWICFIYQPCSFQMQAYVRDKLKKSFGSQINYGQYGRCIYQLVVQCDRINCLLMCNEAVQPLGWLPITISRQATF